ncbi:MAG TPA: amino acid permease [Catalimonadaceae bacterium]|nr:amino acid permease [Catalimonadaceae bacterium]
MTREFFMTDFKRSLGLLDAVMLVSGSMIGSGIFIVAAGMARELGSSGWILVAWIVAGILTVLAALSYGELSGMMPKAGGQYVYIQRAFGRLPAFLYGWTVFTVIQTGVIAAVAVAFAKFTAVFFPALGPENVLLDFQIFKVNAAQIFAIASIVLLTWINTQGVKDGKMLQTLFTLAKIVALLALIGLGLWKGVGSEAFVSNFSDLWNATKIPAGESSGSAIPLSGLALLSALGVAMVGSLFSSDAWNNVTFIAGEIKNPQRNIPLSLFLGTLIVTVLYVLANMAYLSLLPMSDIQTATADRVGTAAASVIFGDVAVYLMAGLIMISTFGCNNGIILAGGRLFYAMSKDSLFFKKAGILNGQSVPGFALWVQCLWASVLCLSGKYGDLLEYTTFASLLFYIVTITGLFVLRKREPEAERPYKAFGYPFLPALYILAASAFCLNLLISSPVFTMAGLLIVFLGWPVYWLTKPDKAI